jgi:hypothetical protein
MTPSTPKKPFPEYKWRWASYTPSEGLLRPEVNIGVLRAMNANEGKRPNSPEFIDALAEIARDTQADINLERSEKRNLIRNAGQYWKVTGLLEGTRGGIKLTGFGKQVAQGRITDSEFALAVVKTLVLPNPRVDSALIISRWRAASLKIKPLQLLLSTMGQLQEDAGGSQAFITPNELIKIVIPLAGAKASVKDCAQALVAYRQGKLSLVDWPDCAPESNDKRIAHEFLLFLWHHGLCRCDGDPSDDKWNRQFSLASLAATDVRQLENIKVPDFDDLSTVSHVRKSPLPMVVEEQQRQERALVLSRPQQAAFRRAVLKGYSSTCLITGEMMPAVLEAAHIISKKNNGADTVNNGICLRADIHNLFDAGHLRIEESGKLHYSDAIISSFSYAALPQAIKIPSFVSKEALKWRWNYK